MAKANYKKTTMEFLGQLIGKTYTQEIHDKIAEILKHKAGGGKKATTFITGIVNGKETVVAVSDYFYRMTEGDKVTWAVPADLAEQMKWNVPSVAFSHKNTGAGGSGYNQSSVEGQKQYSKNLNTRDVDRKERDRLSAEFWSIKKSTGKFDTNLSDQIDKITEKLSNSANYDFKPTKEQVAGKDKNFMTKEQVVAALQKVGVQFNA